jgi:glycosyltransferase involved in cell wall biosynthesis
MKHIAEMQFVSIVIPAYKAEKTIEKSLLKIKDALDKIRLPYEIICVVDGVKVDNTFQKAKKISGKFPKEIKVVGYKKNRGKGEAVRFGMSKAKGDIIGFVDAGLEINPNGISMLLEHFEWYKADIIIGSKRHPASKVIYPWQRKIISWGGQTLVKILFGLNIKDTQVGMKFFRKEVVEALLPRLLVKAFACDIEMLSVANYLGYKRIFEAPIELKMDFGDPSTLASTGFIRTLWFTLIDTLAVFYRLHILHYYDNKNRKNWIKSKYLLLK